MAQPIEAAFALTSEVVRSTSFFNRGREGSNSAELGGSEKARCPSFDEPASEPLSEFLSILSLCFLFTASSSGEACVVVEAVRPILKGERGREAEEEEEERRECRVTSSRVSEPALEGWGLLSQGDMVVGRREREREKEGRERGSESGEVEEHQIQREKWE